MAGGRGSVETSAASCAPYAPTLSRPDAPPLRRPQSARNIFCTSTFLAIKSRISEIFSSSPGPRLYR